MPLFSHDEFNVYKADQKRAVRQHPCVSRRLIKPSDKLKAITVSDVKYPGSSLRDSLEPVSCLDSYLAYPGQLTVCSGHVNERMAALSAPDISQGEKNGGNSVASCPCEGSYEFRESRYYNSACTRHSLKNCETNLYSAYTKKADPYYQLDSFA